MHANDIMKVSDNFVGFMSAEPAPISDELKVVGRFHAVFREADGTIIRDEEFDNLVTIVGKNLLLDSGLSTTASTAGFMGLISAVSFTAVSGTDTMTSHSGWLEAGSTNIPTFSARIACVWSAASSGGKALSAGLTFTFTSSGTVEGGFIVGGPTGSSSTIGNTGGTLFSAGTLATPQPVISTNTLTLSYSATLT